jgi:hypothetical protein
MKNSSRKIICKYIILGVLCLLTCYLALALGGELL